MMRNRPTRDRVLELLSYDSETGIFTWRSRKKKSPHRIGDIAGGLNSCGYIEICVDGAHCLAHRLAWLISHGRWPVLIDHLDGNRGNNSIRNLREATKTINGQNQRKAQSNNKAGILGVSHIGRGHGKPFMAQIRVNGRLKYLGTFDTAEDAGNAYLDAKRKLHEGCTI